MPGKPKAATKPAPLAGTGEGPEPSRPLVKQAKSRVESPQAPAAATAKVAAAKRPAKRAAKTTRSGSSPRAKGLPSNQAESDRFREAVARLAYHFWEVRNGQDNGPDGDWIRAEWAVREVLEKLSPSK